MASFLDSEFNKEINSFSSLRNISSAQDQISQFSNQICKIFAVFDGHGGNEISNALTNGINDIIPSLTEKICQNISLNHNNKDKLEVDEIKQIIHETFIFIDNQLKNIYSGTVGSTGTVVVIYKNQIHIAYVGDSMAMVFKNDEFLFKTIDHKIDTNPEEKSRLESTTNVSKTDCTAFEVISNDSIKATKCYYHNFSYGFYIDKLAVSRAFGHYSVKRLANCALIVDPTINSFEFDDTDNIKIIMASDGVWDVIESSNTETKIKELIDEAKVLEGDVALHISDFCVNRWKQIWKYYDLNENLFNVQMNDKRQWDDVSVVYLELV